MASTKNETFPFLALVGSVTSGPATLTVR